MKNIEKTSILHVTQPYRSEKLHLAGGVAAMATNMFHLADTKKHLVDAKKHLAHVVWASRASRLGISRISFGHLAHLVWASRRQFSTFPDFEKMSRMHFRCSRARRASVYSLQFQDL